MNQVPHPDRRPRRLAAADAVWFAGCLLLGVLSIFYVLAGGLGLSLGLGVPLYAATSVLFAVLCLLTVALPVKFARRAEPDRRAGRPGAVGLILLPYLLGYAPPVLLLLVALSS